MSLKKLNVFKPDFCSRYKLQSNLSARFLFAKGRNIMYTLEKFGFLLLTWRKRAAKRAYIFSSKTDEINPLIFILRNWGSTHLVIGNFITCILGGKNRSRSIGRGDNVIWCSVKQRSGGSRSRLASARAKTKFVPSKCSNFNYLVNKSTYQDIFH